MSKLFWCVGKKAQRPYRLEAFQVSIYSMEELCYLIRRQTDLADKSLMDEALLQYIDDELGLETGELRRLVRFGGSLGTFCQMLLELGECSIPPAEWEEIKSRLAVSEALTPFEGKMKQADTKLEKGNYFAALQAYGRLVGQTEDAGQKAALYGQMGKAAFYLFHYQAAADFFYKSCMLAENTEMRMGYLLCLRFLMDRQEYVRYTTQDETDYELSLMVERMVTDAQERAQARADAMPERPDRRKLIKEFREMME